MLVPTPFTRFDRPRGPRASIVVTADVHVSAERTGTWKGFDTAVDRLRDAVRRANNLDVDAFVLAGDATETARADEAAVVDDSLAALDAPALSVPGNHDVAGGESVPLASAPDDFPHVYSVGGVDLVAVDTATGAGGRGALAPDQRRRLDETLAAVDTPVVVCHHNVLDADAHATSPPPGFTPLDGAPTLRALLARHDVPLVVSGHAHWPAVARDGGLREVVVPPACSYPLAALHVAVTPRGTTLTTVPLGDALDRETAYQRAAAGPGRARYVASNAVDAGVGLGDGAVNAATGIVDVERTETTY